VATRCSSGHPLFVADIAGPAVSAAAVLRDLRRDLLQFFQSAAQDHHPGVQGGQLVGDAAAKTAATTGDNDGLVLEQTRCQRRLVYAFLIRHNFNHL
jgi:hypothetical protein